MAQIDDLTDEADPVNVPATSDEHPNWRRRLSMTLDELAARPRFIDIAEYFRAERGGPKDARRGTAGMSDPAPVVPLATYRLQFRKEFGFDDAAALAPYLARLGISHVYASPYLKARPGSTHGYDIVDHDRLNPELGDDAAFRRMVSAFRENGLGQVLDFVPNHMGVGGADNPLWLNVLEWGPDPVFAGWFDIDWDAKSHFSPNSAGLPPLGGSRWQ